MIEGCGFGPCVDSLERGGAGCDLCDRVAHIPPVEQCPKDVGDQRCRLEAGHEPPCDAPRRAEKVDTAPTRDGDPKLAAERKRGNLAFQKRHREGPVRQQRR